jgi:hypothetical protein
VLHAAVAEVEPLVKTQAELEYQPVQVEPAAVVMVVAVIAEPVQVLTEVQTQAAEAAAMVTLMLPE